MLSIRFYANTEWSVSNEASGRLVKAALRHGMMPAHLEEWRHIADANWSSRVSTAASQCIHLPIQFNLERISLGFC